MNITQDRIERVIIASFKPSSGARVLLLCEHIVAGAFCYDVGWMNIETGDKTWRHYNPRVINDDSARKAEAIRVFDEHKKILIKNDLKPRAEEPKSQFRIVSPNGKA